MASRVALLLTLVFVVGWWPVEARACSAWPDCLPPSVALPPDGSLDVPLNVEVEALLPFLPGGTPVITPRLRVADTGEEVLLVPARTPGRFRSDGPLDPSTRYELLAPREAPLRSFPSETSCTSEPVVISTFTTGDAIDSTAPRGVTAAGNGCSVSTCSSSACCGPYVAAISSASWHATDERALPVAYAFGSPDGPRTFATGGAATSFSGIGNPLASSGRIPGASPVFAIDAAGNVSLESASFDLDFSCQPTPEEAEERARCDGAATCPRPSSGCSAAPRASSPALYASLLAVSLAALGRRRSR
ncbi:MAG: hypothetical protein M3Y87_23655 [Myxococcota bacterium]|nr:hypothetical protein [Myxococcota bacterium]